MKAGGEDIVRDIEIDTNKTPSTQHQTVAFGRRTRCYVDDVDALALRKLPSQSVFSSASSDNENLEAFRLFSPALLRRAA